MKQLLAMFTGGRGASLRRLDAIKAPGSSPVSFSQELADAIAAAQITSRASNDDGPRIIVICDALRGAFIFDREETARRIRLAFPELTDEGVARGVRQLTARVRLKVKAEPVEAPRKRWVDGWMGD